MNKPIIGISTSVLADESGEFAGYERIYVNKDYVSAVLRAGGVPLMIPMEEDEENLRKTVSILDGIIFSGGQDIAPERYGEEPHAKLGGICPERDAFDFPLYRLAKEHSLPILGICRGFQLMTVAEGGSLYQDLSEREKESLKHNQGSGPSVPTHTVKLEKESKLFAIFGKEEIRVNSFHHQAVKNVAPSVSVSGRALDEVVEAIELKDYPFGIAVQFHPEMLQEKNEDMRKIFSALVSAAEAHKKDEGEV